MYVNRQWLIAERPSGRAVREEDFAWVTGEARQPGDGEVLVRTLYLGFDPSLKGQIENRTTYAAATRIGQVAPGRGVGEVVASGSDRFRPGDKVVGVLGWQDYATLGADALEEAEHVDLLSAYLGVLGTTGLTAYLGLQKIGRPFPGDTMVVTGAAGATGSVVGQLGRIAGCRVIGVAGGDEKCRWLVDELGFDGAIDYKAGDVGPQLARLAPNGVDLLWDNVGGELLDVLLDRIALNARVVLCGGISRYSVGRLPPGPQNYFNLVLQRASMEGFIVLDWKDEFPLARRRLTAWLRDGRLRHREDIQEGLEHAPRAFARLFEGANLGKQLLKVA
jgi:NADPH-dependent curcumin reductase CurA